jgi:hypothetical protein
MQTKEQKETDLYLVKKYKRSAYKKLTPSEKMIASVRREIVIDINENGLSVDEARMKANKKYGKGWRERGLCSNSGEQWPEEELLKFR